MSPPASTCTVAPSLLITWPPRPGMRIFRPFRSSAVAISRWNQPPIWAPVLPPGRLRIPKSANRGARSSLPPPWVSHAVCWRADMPKGTQVSKAKAGCLPV